jgi:hypothetical protein
LDIVRRGRSPGAGRLPWPKAALIILILSLAVWTGIGCFVWWLLHR